VLPKPRQSPHPPVWGATGSVEGHRMMGELGLGLLSFSVGTPPEELKQRIDVYRSGLAACQKPLGKVINDRAACFTMVNCAPTRQESYDAARESFGWYAKTSAELVASVPVWLEEMKAERDGTYDYLDVAKQAVEQRLHELASLDALLAMNAVIAGDPDEVVQRCKAYEATGADLLLCLVNPYKIPHAQVMQTIELMGKYVIPEFGHS
jgi:alkanesulfonate monooxygenase SsuD/methylene tetrahydromethanopterin reductase-like flavin-dependent oxidoreductase (luciferase family)